MVERNKQIRDIIRHVMGTADIHSIDVEPNATITSGYECGAPNGQRHVRVWR